MATIEYTGDALVVHVTGWDTVWALKSHLTIPLAHVISANPPARRHGSGGRGSGCRARISPGSSRRAHSTRTGGRVFWDVHDADRAVAIHLRDDQYTELVMEVDDPAATIARVNGHAQR